MRVHVSRTRRRDAARAAPRSTLVEAVVEAVVEVFMAMTTPVYVSIHRCRCICIRVSLYASPRISARTPVPVVPPSTPPGQRPPVNAPVVAVVAVVAVDGPRALQIPMRSPALTKRLHLQSACPPVARVEMAQKEPLVFGGAPCLEDPLVPFVGGIVVLRRWWECVVVVATVATGILSHDSSVVYLYFHC